MMCDLVSDEEKFDRILSNIINDVPLDDLGETESSVFGPPTTNRQVLAPLAAAEGSYSNQFPIMTELFSTGFIEGRCWLTRKKELRANSTVLTNTHC